MSLSAAAATATDAIISNPVELRIGPLRPGGESMSLALPSGASNRHIYTSESCDRSLEIRRLRRNLLTLIHSHPHTEALGDDNLVEALASSAGIARHEICVLRVRIRAARSHTLVCVLSRLWHDIGGKDALIALKRMADEAGRACILVPETAVQRQPRLGTARAIEQALGVSVTAEDRLAILVHLIDVGFSTLMDCASLVKGEAPVSVVLSLVAEGAIRMSTDRLRPDSRIDLPSAGFWAA